MEGKEKELPEFNADKFAVALGMSRIAVDNMTAEIIFETYKKVLELGGEFSLSDAAKITTQVEEKYKKREA